MQVLIEKIRSLKSHPINETITGRLSEFNSYQSKLNDGNTIFLELAFCLMTANFQAAKSITIQKEVGEGFLHWSEEELASKLKSMGHRFWPQAAKRIVMARTHIVSLPSTLGSLSGNDLRYWFADNVHGLGMKESSHFLRNIGFGDYAIIDFHIVDILVSHGLLEQPKSKSLTPKKYLEIENILKSLGREVGMNMAELDLALWFLETGTVLK
jgi:N-glycosylase/DNA lyase